MHKSNNKRFFKAYHTMNRMAEVPYLYKKYNLKCLRKALILFYFSKKCGVETTIKMGMHHYGRFLSGHAWLELKNKPLDTSTDFTKYKCIFSQNNILISK